MTPLLHAQFITWILLFSQFRCGRKYNGEFAHRDDSCGGTESLLISIVRYPRVIADVSTIVHLLIEVIGAANGNCVFASFDCVYVDSLLSGGSFHVHLASCFSCLDVHVTHARLVLDV